MTKAAKVHPQRLPGPVRLSPLWHRERPHPDRHGYVIVDDPTFEEVAERLCPQQARAAA